MSSRQRNCKKSGIADDSSFNNDQPSAKRKKKAGQFKSNQASDVNNTDNFNNINNIETIDNAEVLLHQLHMYHVFKLCFCI